MVRRDSCLYLTFVLPTVFLILFYDNFVFQQQCPPTDLSFNFDANKQQRQLIAELENKNRYSLSCDHCHTCVTGFDLIFWLVGGKAVMHDFVTLICFLLQPLVEMMIIYVC